MLCSTIDAWNLLKNGRISGGSSAMARAMMNLWASKPQAAAGVGDRDDDQDQRQHEDSAHDRHYIARAVSTVSG